MGRHSESERTRPVCYLLDGCWRFELQVVTPDNKILTRRGVEAGTFMDWSLFEYKVGQLRDDVSVSLKQEGYFN